MPIFTDTVATALAQEPRAVQLWTLRTDPEKITDDLVHYSMDILSPDEKARAARFRFDALQRSFIVTRGALRTVLGLYLGCVPASLAFVYGVNGKPSILGAGPLQFNASHSGGFAVFVITHGVAIGVDVERKRPIDNMEAIAQRFFCPEEAEELLSLPEQDRAHGFFLGWTRKEAYIKATGAALSAALDSFRVSLNPAQLAHLVHIDGSAAVAQQWTLQSFEFIPGYAAAVAYHDLKRPCTIFPIFDIGELLQR